MELNELKHIWKKQEKQEDIDYSRSELMMLINNKMISLEKEIQSRDRREIIAAIVLVISFGIILLTTDSFWKQLGSVVIIVSAVFIWYRLKSSQAATLADDPSRDRPMREYLALELNSVKQQKQLLQSVASWYIIPIWSGLLIYTLGFSSGLLFKVGYMAMVTLLGIGIWKMNQNAVTRKFEPLIKEIREAQEFVNRGNSTSD